MSTKIVVIFNSIGEAFSCWIDSVADLAASLLGRFASPRTVRLVEDENSDFVVQSDQGAAAERFDRVRMSGGRIDDTKSAALATIARWQSRRIGAAAQSFSFSASRASQARHRIYARCCAIPDRSTDTLECGRCRIWMGRTQGSRYRQDDCYHRGDHSCFD